MVLGTRASSNNSNRVCRVRQGEVHEFIDRSDIVAVMKRENMNSTATALS